MKFYVTGQHGFVAKNLKIALEKKNHEVIDDVELFAGGTYQVNKNGEACVHRISEDLWYQALYDNDIDTVIHNAAIVGTDVVALNPSEACLSNVQGTHNIVRAANRAKAGICYLGTTVIYDTAKYQDKWITESSDKKPTTYYGIQKLAAENIVTSFADKWSIVRPLFAFGGDGDNNSLIAKTLYANLAYKKNVDIFLDPMKIKDYLHVSDFCNAVELVCRDSAGRGWGTDWNVAAETPIPVHLICNEITKHLARDASSIIKWHPSTDYLGNHRLSAEKIRTKLGWKPVLDLSTGIFETMNWIKCGHSGYNPLKYLENAASSGIDLLQHFPKSK